MDEQVRADQLAAKYVALRDFYAKIKAEGDEKLSKINAAMDKIETEMMTFLNQTGAESSKTKSGTFFKKTASKAKVADRDVFLHFVMETEATNFLTSAVSNEAVNEYVTEHGKVPPGIDVVRTVSIGVNRPKTR